MEYYHHQSKGSTNTRRDLENIMLSKRSQMPKTTYYDSICMKRTERAEGRLEVIWGCNADWL